MRGTRGSAESAADIDAWIRTALEPLEPDAIPTAPPPPHSDIRRIGRALSDPDEDPFDVYVDALRQPAVEIEPRTLPPPAPRARRQTMVMPMRPRQMTLPMIDRPRALAPSTRPVADPPVPRPFRGAMPVLLLAFGAGIFLSGATVFVLTHF